MAINILMKPNFNEKLIAYLTLACGIGMSAVAIFYSVSGLLAIYPSAMLAIIIMGVAIEVSKLSMTLWLKQNWHAPWIYKWTMLPAVILLMLITSAGVFGFLSKAHSDQTLISGDAVSNVQIIDDKIVTVRDAINTERENIAAARSALAQLDSQVNARLDRGTDEASAERSVQIRRNQRTERAALNKEITDAQNEITKLNDRIAELNAEKAPLAGELRKVEAEVGPIKYIAALIYGDNPDSNLLERAVRWFTVLIVIVLDPVAILLLLASQYSFQQFREQKIVADIPKEETELKEPESAPPENQAEEQVTIEDLIDNTTVDSEKEISDVIEDTLEKNDSWIEATVEIKSPDSTTVESFKHESKIDEEPIFVQNEEQQYSNKWTNATSSISKEQYIEKIASINSGKKDS